MLTQKTAIVAIIMVAFLGVSPVTGWAEPVPLTDLEMDAIYAQGIFVDLNINIAMPNGSTLSMPGVNVPLPDMPGMPGSSSGGTSGTMSVTPVSSTATPSNTSTGSTPVVAVAPSNPTSNVSTNTNTTNVSAPSSTGGGTAPAASSPSPVNTGSASAPAPTVAAATPAASTPTSTTMIVPTTSAASIGNGAMTNNSGLIITAPGAAVSIVLNVAVFNNSVLNGDFMQSAHSNVRTFSFSFSSFSF